MWVITTHGFYSVVAYNETMDMTDKNKDHKAVRYQDPVVTDKVLVRARSEEDIQYLCEKTHTKYHHTPNADYEYRTVVLKKEWSKFLVSEVETLDYPNFKSRVSKVQGSERSSIYHGVWSSLMSIGSPLKYKYWDKLFKPLEAKKSTKSTGKRKPKTPAPHPFSRAPQGSATGFFSDENGDRSTKVHVVDLGDHPMCGAKITSSKTFQMLAFGVVLDYLECEPCIALAEKHDW